MNRSHPLSHLGEIEATNPCGEISLLPYESCNLGSVNLDRMVRERNATRTAIAPTGTISIIGGTSPSIEPFYSLAYRRTRVLSGETLRTVNPLVEEWIEKHGLDLDRTMRHVRRTGTPEGLPDLRRELRELFLTALEIPGERHLEVQKAFHEHVDNAVSKTINLPEEAEPGEIADLYRRAWELGLKGITVFRQGSKGEQVMEPGDDGEETAGGQRDRREDDHHGAESPATPGA